MTRDSDTEPSGAPAITERELAFALNYHSDDARIGDADWKIARRYFEVIEANRGTHPSLAAAPQPAPAAEPTRSQKLRDAGYTRRPSWRSLPKDGDDESDEEFARQIEAFDREGKAAPAAEPLTDEQIDAARYRWLRARVEVRPTQSVAGSIRDALEIRIGCAFLDSPTPYTVPEEYPAQKSAKLDAAIDAAIQRPKPPAGETPVEP